MKHPCKITTVVAVTGLATAAQALGGGEIPRTRTVFSGVSPAL